ncbi:flagellar biosynthesis anti-sigma factor FlgM [Onishia niordana]|uniref:flagellar biosynthesis anti-sigma factor FlgM n=1 Tax=Onishia niordana TaxID=2508711 RepID=UPI00197AC118|nr:flagellar biosynthesis anti-sigma factor FlgM [Halomonas niordiana]
MKIDSSQSLIRLQSSDQPTSAKTAPAGNAQTSAAPNSASVAHLNQGNQNASGDIDTARVEELRLAISEGRMEIDANKIADGLIASVQDILDGESS